MVLSASWATSLIGTDACGAIVALVFCDRPISTKCEENKEALHGLRGFWNGRGTETATSHQIPRALGAYGAPLCI